MSGNGFEVGALRHQIDGLDSRISIFAIHRHAENFGPFISLSQDGEGTLPSTVTHGVASHRPKDLRIRNP